MIQNHSLFFFNATVSQIHAILIFGFKSIFSRMISVKCRIQSSATKLLLGLRVPQNIADILIYTYYTCISMLIMFSFIYYHISIIKLSLISKTLFDNRGSI